MGVMLRVAGIPSRVAIGFTPGVQVNDYLSISTQDAHAWVEAYFGGKGWVTFDPTPLSDGRGITPSYLQAGPQDGKQPVVVSVTVALKVGTEVEQRRWKQVPGHQEQSQEQTADTTITIEKRVDRFELIMCQRGMNKRRKHSVVEEFFPRREVFE